LFGAALSHCILKALFFLIIPKIVGDAFSNTYYSLIILHAKEKKLFCNSRGIKKSEKESKKFSVLKKYSVVFQSLIKSHCL
jgi:hypothetical protein